MTQGTQTRTLYQLEGRDEEGGGREVQEGMDICISIADLSWYLLETKDPSSQGYGFFSGPVWMWELDCEESWVPMNWCFWTVVLEKTL